MGQSAISETHLLDGNGRPAGGETLGIGFAISWQNGPLAVVAAPPSCSVHGRTFWDPTPDRCTWGTGGPSICPRPVVTERVQQSGAFVEDVIAAAIGRIEHYQGSQFHCVENAVALGHLKAAAEVLAERTRGREARGVEGTHQL